MCIFRIWLSAVCNGKGVRKRGSGGKRDKKWERGVNYGKTHGKSEGEIQRYSGVS